MMKNLRLRVVFCALLMAAAVLSTTGCSRIKGLFSRKSGASPDNTETSGNVQPPPVSPSGERTNPAAAPAATPSRPPVAAINKSAAVMVLCYHRLEEKPRPNDTLAMTPGEFEKEMQQIKDAGFTVIPMQEMLAWRRGDKDIPPKSCVITIDDGYVSGYDTAWPILKKFGYPFTMFVYVNYINSGGKSISWDQLADMRNAGVDIESHTYSHGDLRNPNDKYAVDKHTFDMIQNDVKTLGVDGWLRKEIVDSKKVLEQQLGIKVNAIAYPFGKYDQKVRDLVKEAGYEAGFTVYGQRLSYGSPAFDLLGRYAVEQQNPKIFQEALTMTGGGTGGLPSGTPAVSQLAAAGMVTVPAQDETISDPRPTIKANLAAMGEVDPKTVEMRISGFGVVPAKYDAPTKTVSFKVTQDLRDKSYTVLLNATVAGKRAETRWTFNFDPKATGSVKPSPKP